MPVFQFPFDINFKLDLSGVLGAFGGDSGLAVMDNILLLPNRRWMGWYNSPGGYFVAQKYGTLPKSTFWDTLFPGEFENDAKKGPKFVGVYSGIQCSETEYLAYLLCRHCDSKHSDDEDFYRKTTVKVPMQEELEYIGNATNFSPEKGHTITIVDFHDVDMDGCCKDIPANSFTSRTIFAFTVLFSLTCTIFSALFGDYTSSSTILYGILANGLMSLILGSGDLLFNARKVPNSTPRGDGILFDSNRANTIIVLGREHTISIFRGSQFQVKYRKDPQHSRIGSCSIILLLQFFWQLWAIPRGTLIGQLFFLASFAVSWACNRYIASQNFENIYTAILLNAAPCNIYKFPVKHYSTVVAFIMGYFRMSQPEGFVDALFPNNLGVWSLWKKCICKAIKDKRNPSQMIIASPDILESQAVYDDPLRNSTREPQASMGAR